MGIELIMPLRKVPLVTDEIYHIFNRTVGGALLYKDVGAYQRFLDLLNFYRFKNNNLRFSHYYRLSKKQKKKYLVNLNSTGVRCEIYAFCLMPNHYHLLVKQRQDEGISNSLRLIQNSFAKFYNLKYKRKGPLFESRFSGVRMETEEQLIHVCRYIHLNPFSSYVLENMAQLERYPWNSYLDYLGDRPRSFVETSYIKGMFGNLVNFKKFTEDRADYQRSLEMFKHLETE